MARFVLGALATSIVATAIFATPAHAIKNEKDCTVEGGTMVNLKGSDFCLVPIRPEAYRDEIYDGNQLGVTECPGNKLNDGLYCMYPVTLREGEGDMGGEAEMVEEAVESNDEAEASASEDSAE